MSLIHYEDRCDQDSESDSEEDINNFSNNNIRLDSITFSFEKPPKQGSWIETHKRLEEGKNEFYYPYHHDYPKVLLPYEYPASDRIKLLSGKKGPGFGKRKGRKMLDDGKSRKSPRCHASTLAVMSNFLRRPLRESSKTVDFSYEEESRSSLPDTVETSSSTSEFRINSSLISSTSILPVDPSGDIFATAIVRVACGETNTFEIDSRPCLPIHSTIYDSSFPDVEICLRPGLTIPLEAIVEKNDSDTSWMDYDYSNDFGRESDHQSNYLQQSSAEVMPFDKSGPYRWPEVPHRKKRKKTKKMNELAPCTVVTPDIIKCCAPCEIKLEPMSAEILEHFSIKDDPLLLKQEPQPNISTPSSAESQPVKRGRGRPRKKNLNADDGSSSTELTSLSQHPPSKTYLKKDSRRIQRFSFIPSSYIDQIV